MKNKKMIIVVAMLISLAAYLFLAHYLIYKRISFAGLKSSDAKGEYIIGSGASNIKSYNYTALGDSLTSGVGVMKYEESFPYLLAEKMSDSGNIILRDRAYPGAKTGDLIENLLTSAINDNPDVITLLIGVNDIHGNVGKAKFSQNYNEILRQLKSRTKAKIYAINIPFIGTDALLLPPWGAYFRYQTIEYNKIIKKLTQENGVEYVDLHTPTAHMFESPSLCAPDLFHPSVHGYQLWAQIIYAAFMK
jgi:lysophospholipase L1-like esterase